MRSDVETEEARLETPAGRDPGNGDAPPGAGDAHRGVGGAHPEAGNAHIVVVDDEPANARLVARMLAASDYDRIDIFTRPASALDALNGHRPDLLVLDLQMPDMNGLELMQRFREATDGPLPVPVLFLTSDGSREAKEKALRAGAQDFLVKPLSPLEVRLRVKNLLETRRLERALAERNERLDALVEERTAELEDARLETLEKLALAAEYRDDETGEHIRRVGRLSARLGHALGLDEDRIEVLRQAAPLHDVGKIGINDSILRKPDSLTEHEFEVMKSHTTIGAEILSGSRSSVLRGAETIARSHHENWDGSGYPDGLAGSEIPLEARIVAVADVFDSLTHERVYKGATPEPEAEEKIRELDGTKFDPQVVRAFAIVRDAAST